MTWMRNGLRVTLSIIPLLLPLTATWAQTGAIERVMKKGRAQVHWNFLGAKPSQIGVLLELDLAIGIFQVLDSEGLEGTIGILDTGAAGVFEKGRDLRLLEITRPTAEPGKASLLVWSQQLDAVVLVDGNEAGKSPLYLCLDAGEHEIVVRLAEGGSAGARVEVKSGSEGTLYLFGFQREASVRWNPSYLLETARSDTASPTGGKALQWIDESGGARIYLGAAPVKRPILTHKVMPTYPSGALKAGFTGNVAIEAIAGADGLIHGARVIASQDSLLAQAALEAIQQWTYKPGTLRGEAVPVVFKIQVEFGMGHR